MRLIQARAVVVQVQRAVRVVRLTVAAGAQELYLQLQALPLLIAVVEVGLLLVAQAGQEETAAAVAAGLSLAQALLILEAVVVEVVQGQTGEQALQFLVILARAA